MKSYLKHTIKGSLSWSVEKDGNIIRRSSVYNNLILKQGLNFIASYAFADCFKYCCVGSGIVAPNSSNTSLNSEIKRTSTCDIAPNSNGSQFSSNIFSIFRTFVFVADTVAYTYGEVGFSPIASSGSNLFSKALIKDGLGNPTTVFVNIGERLLVQYTLSIEIHDATKIISSGIKGAASTGLLRAQKIALKGIDISGNTIDYDDALSANEPSNQSTIFISNVSTAPDLFNTCFDRTPAISKTGQLSTYVNGQYSRKKVATFIPAELASMSPFRSVGVGSASSHGLIMVFDAEQSAPTNMSYVVSFTYNWANNNGAGFVPWLQGDDMTYLNKRISKNNTYAYFAL